MKSKSSPRTFLMNCAADLTKDIGASHLQQYSHHSTAIRFVIVHCLASFVQQNSKIGGHSNPFGGITYHICGVSLPPIQGHLEVWGTQRIDNLIKVILHCKMVQIGHFQRVIREVSRGCLMVPIFLTGQDMSIFR